MGRGVFGGFLGGFWGVLGGFRGGFRGVLGGFGVQKPLQTLYETSIAIAFQRIYEQNFCFGSHSVGQ